MKRRVLVPAVLGLLLARLGESARAARRADALAVGLHARLARVKTAEDGVQAALRREEDDVNAAVAARTEAGAADREAMRALRAEAAALGVQVSFFQSNHEGALVDAIHQAYFDHVDGIVINPAAYTHTSVALLDAVKAVGIPTVEVHVTDPDSREPFRRVSYIRAACVATIKGRGLPGYQEAMRLLCGK